MLTSNASRRRVRWFLPVFGIATVIAAACGGGGDNGPTQPARSDTTLTASLDGGTPFTGATATITSAAGRLLIIASNGPNESMGLGFDFKTGLNRVAPAAPLPRVMCGSAREVGAQAPIPPPAVAR